MKKTTLLLAFFLFYFIAYSQVVINELSPSNNTTIADEDGDYPDWIELYNSGAVAVNLAGYRLSDDVNLPAKWVFPAGVVIQPSGYITLFASGKDRNQFFNHWETVVNATDLWRYQRPLMEPDSNWRRLSSYNDAAWSQGAGGIGYGDGDDNTVIPGLTTSVYMRRVFTITDTADLSGAVFHMDYDDAFVAYINGVEIARSNIGVNGTPAAYNVSALNEHEAKMYTGGMPDQFFLEESYLKSFLRNGNNVLAIQVHNVSATSSDLSSLPWLSLGIKSASTNYGPVPAWFTLNGSFMHTNFKLSQNSESVYLSSPGGALLSQRTWVDILSDDSYGCLPDGSVTMRYFGTPTPDASNNTSTGYNTYTADPTFVPDGGFYSTPVSLTISSTTAGAIIHYTTDGSEPDASSPIFTSPLQIDSTMVIKARTYHASLLEGNVVTNTYFIADSASTNLPVISLSVSPQEMFDTLTGIYVKGPNAETAIPFSGANFWQEREIEAHIEFFDKQRQLGFEQNVGIEIYGNYSRSFPQKSMKIIARNSYGSGSFNYQLFPGKDIHSFNQFIIRNAGTDWNSAHMRDALVHNIALQPTDCDVMAYQPAVVYINGQYWGVYNMREKINKDYLNDNHDIDKDSVDLLQYNGLVMEGSNERFIQMGTYVLFNDMSDDANFAVADSLLDLKNVADYWSMETWSSNWDWLTNNVRYWREIKDGAKWRYILWDLDNGMGGNWSYVVNSLDTNLNKIFDYTSLLFNKLLTNEGYKHYFINRYADLLNTALTPAEFNKVLYGMRDTIDAEMPRHFARWGTGFNNPNWGVGGFGSYNDWYNYQMHELEAWAANRQITARNHIQETFGLNKQVPVTINVYPPGAGKIIVNTITLEDMPWSGIYFDSVPVTLTAVANAGYTFGFWQSPLFYPTPETTVSLTFNPDTADVFTAYFMGVPDTAVVVFSEINYRSPLTADAGDWVEIHNSSEWPMDLSGWKFKDSDNANMFVFPDNSCLNGGEYLVLAEDLLKFNTHYPAVTNVMGSFNFGLSSTDESIRLFDGDMRLYQTIHFTSLPPWSTEVNGSGRTLELLSDEGIQDDANNWFAGCPGGSPGGPFIPCENAVEEMDATVAVWAKVYPNPASDVLHLIVDPEMLGDDALSFELYDMSGWKVYGRSDIRDNETLIPGGFAPGLYYYRLLATDGSSIAGKVLFL